MDRALIWSERGLNELKRTFQLHGFLEGPTDFCIVELSQLGRLGARSEPTAKILGKDYPADLFPYLQNLKFRNPAAWIHRPNIGLRDIKSVEFSKTGLMNRQGHDLSETYDLFKICLKVRLILGAVTFGSFGIW